MSISAFPTRSGSALVFYTNLFLLDGVLMSHLMDLAAFRFHRFPKAVMLQAATNRILPA